MCICLVPFDLFFGAVFAPYITLGLEDRTDIICQLSQLALIVVV